MKTKKRKLWKIPVIILTVFLILLLGYTGYTLTNTREATQTLAEYQATYPNSVITQAQDGSVSLLPAAPATDKNTGIIFYQGLTVEPLAYVPFLSGLSDVGYSVFVPQLPCNMALFDLDAADEVMEQHPEITDWYIAGHSMGGRCASKYAAANGDKLSGVISVSSQVDKKLASAALPLLIVYGDLDSVMGELQSADELPADTTVRCITGANHAQFGDYGLQPMDTEATISPEDQRAQGAEAILTWLNR